MQRTKIEWTDFTANPIKYRRKSDGKTVWACVKHSPGCANCYAEAIANRFDQWAFTAANMNEVEPYLDEAECRKMLTAKKLGGVAVSGSRCFVGDMTDVFGEWVSDAMLDRLFAVFAIRSDVTWQVLTKRADRMAEWASDHGRLSRVSREAWAMGYGIEWMGFNWPLPNVWLGVSVEDQKRADERIPHLLRTPAAVRFLSCEPLLDRVSFCWAKWQPMAKRPGERVGHLDGLKKINWVITGGESGPKSRACHEEWERRIIDQCKAAGVAVFRKQAGSNAYRDGQRVRYRDPKGGDPDEWPADLRVREFPETN